MNRSASSALETSVSSHFSTGREVLLEVLATEGVGHIFGNPGTTELPLMDELAVRDDFQYMLALQENVAVAMADGFAQITRRPAFVNLHTAAGLGGGMGNLFNAWTNRSPLVVTAGQQHQAHLISEPLLAGDLTRMAGPVSKWQHEVRSLADLGPVLRRAFLHAAAPPAGPVFVSLPMDVLEANGAVRVPPRSNVKHAVGSPEIPSLAKRLSGLGVGRVMIIAGEEVGSSSAIADLVDVAERLCADVYGAPLHGCQVFPTDHTLWRGALHPVATSVHDVTARYSAVLVAGAKAILVSPYTVGPAIATTTALFHLSEDPAQIGRDYSTEMGIAGNIKQSLRALACELRQDRHLDERAAALDALRRSRADDRLTAENRAIERYGREPIDPMAAAHALVEALPSEAVIVDEAVTTSIYLRHLWKTAAEDSYFACRGGGLGWAMPASLGIKLARPERPVLAVVGDGTAMYALQALWTAAHHEIPVVFAVVNNREYGVLKRGLSSLPRTRQAGKYIGMDLTAPTIDYVSLAASLGVASCAVDRASEVTEITKQALASGRPFLIDISISSLTGRRSTVG